jgi:hypothetical protein
LPELLRRTNEHVDRPDRVLLSHVVVRELRKQDALPAILALDEPLPPRAISWRPIGEPGYDAVR